MPRVIIKYSVEVGRPSRLSEKATTLALAKEIDEENSELIKDLWFHDGLSAVGSLQHVEAFSASLTGCLAKGALPGIEG